jgi:ATP-dependent DNA helicase RecG
MMKIARIGFTESEIVEYKESLSERRSAGESLCGFSNQHGGTIYFGVKNNGEIVGLQSVTEKTLRDLSHYLFDNFEPQLIFNVTKEICNGEQIIKVVVDRSATPYHTFCKTPYIRIGPNTNPMPQKEYQRRLISYTTTNRDYSATLVEGFSVSDLSKDALVELRKRLMETDRYDVDITALSDEQLLKDLLLMRDGKLTLAALILLGTESTLSHALPYAEIRFGYKLSEGDIRNHDTAIYKGGYLLYYNALWEKINARNLTLTIPFGMRVVERKTFDEESIREGINNAIIHRDYLLSESVFIFQYQSKISLKSPGGFLEGITEQNILDESKPRNKLLSDVLFKCNLVEQFGNGVNKMYKHQLSLGKNPPSFKKTTKDRVVLELDGTIQDIEFARYVLTVADKKNKELTDEELVVLHNIKDNRKILQDGIVDELFECGLIEKIRSSHYMLSKQYYIDMDQKGKYTRKKGLTKNTNKELILQNLRDFGSGTMSDFEQVFKFELSKKEISNLLESLKREGKIYFEGSPRSHKGSWKLKI